MRLSVDKDMQAVSQQYLTLISQHVSWEHGAISAIPRSIALIHVPTCGYTASARKSCGELGSGNLPQVACIFVEYPHFFALCMAGILTTAELDIISVPSLTRLGAAEELNGVPAIFMLKNTIHSSFCLNSLVLMHMHTPSR